MIGHLNPAVPLPSATVIILDQILAAVWTSRSCALIRMGAVCFSLELSIPGNVSSCKEEGLLWADHPVSCRGACYLPSGTFHRLGGQLGHPKVRGQKEGLGLGASGGGSWLELNGLSW